MKTLPWPLCAILFGTSSILLGCASPFSSPISNQDIYERLSGDGIHPPSGQGAAPDHRRHGAESALPMQDVSLTDLLQLADRANPDLQSARSAVGVAAGKTWQAGLYPNPEAYTISSELGFKDGSSNTIVGVAQPIVIGGRLRAAVAAADAEEAANLANVERVRREVFGRVGELHARVLELDAQLKLVDELISLGEQTLAIAETRFTARAVAEPDVIRPRIEVHQLRADRQRIVQELNAVEIQLGFILNTDPIPASRLDSHISTEPEALNEAFLIASVEADHPALFVADREVEAAEAIIQRIRAERVPDSTVSAGVGYSQEGDQGIAELGLGATLPIWDRRQGDIMSARFDLMKRRQSRVATRNRLLSELAEAIGAYNSARDQLAVIRDQVVPDAQRAFDQIDESYRAGRSSFIDLLDAQRTLMQSRRTLIELAGRASVSMARIAAISGIDLLVGSRHQQPNQIPFHPTTAPDGAEDIK